MNAKRILRAGAASLLLASGSWALPGAVSASAPLHHVTIFTKRSGPDWAFSPKRMTIKVGTAVTWANETAVTHDLTFLTGRTFDKDFGRGSKVTLTFTKPGIYAYYCDRHPGMVGVLVVKW